MLQAKYNEITIPQVDEFEDPAINCPRSITNGLTNRNSFWRRLKEPFLTKRPTHSESIDPSNVTAESLHISTNATATIPSETRPGWSVEYQTAESRKIEVTFVRAFNPGPPVLSVKFSPDGKYLAACLGDYSGKAFICKVENAKEVCVLKEGSQDLPVKKGIGIESLCFTPDGRHLAIAGTDSRIRLWEISKKRMCSTYTFSGYVPDLDVSPNGRFLACTLGQDVVMWCIRDGSKKTFGDSTADRYSFIKFSRNGQCIVTVDPEDTLRMWNTRSGDLIARWAKHENHIRSVMGLRGSYHKSLRFWTISSVATAEADQQEELPSFTGHTNRMYSNAVAVSPDGRSAVSSLKNGDVHLWNTYDGQHQCSLLGHISEFVTADFSPVGNYLSVGADNYLTLWSYKHKAN